MTEVTDQFERRVRDLRISVTDRCNFRCTYCMPKEVFGPDHVFLPRDQLLTFEEITSVVRTFVSRGVNKVRITGGEPLLRKQIEVLVAALAAVDGVEDLTLTTNASLLARKAPGLAEAGLDRVTVSLDAMDDPTFQ
ncbi:MAG: radical SAM protein, partial [Acidimicrobiia bacterium]